MARLQPHRFARIALALAVAGIHSAGAIAYAAPSPALPSAPAAIQSASPFLPDFGELPLDANLISSGIGDIDPAIGEPATITVERLRIAPGDEVPASNGPQILQVEHGTLTYTDDLGLDAELQADDAQFFPAGNTTPITNEAAVPAIVVRTTVSGATAPESSQPDDSNGDSDTDRTGERPTPTEEGDSGSMPGGTLDRSKPIALKLAATATPAASPVAATPTATPTETATATPTPTPSTARLGVLLQGDLTALPAADQQLYAAQVQLQPGDELTITESSGPIGLATAGGDLSVEREGRTPSKLRNGLSVILPTGISATLANDGDAPIVLQIAGISGTGGEQTAPDSTATAAAPEVTPNITPSTDETPSADETPAADATPSLDGEPVDVSGEGRFFPTNSEMENLGLIFNSAGSVNSTDPADSAIWFNTRDEAAQKLPDYNWQHVRLETYDSGSNDTDFGEIGFFALNVDTFDTSADATDFYNYIRDDVFGGSASHSRDIGNLPDVDSEMRIAYYNNDDEREYGLMVIQSGNYIVSIYTFGPSGLNAIGLMEAVANLVFGARG